MYRLGLRGIRRGLIVDTIRRRDTRIPPIGVRQREAGIVDNRGSIYITKIEYPQVWITEMSRVYTNLINSNLSDDEKKKSFNYIRAFLFHCKNVKIQGEDYLWAAPYSNIFWCQDSRSRFKLSVSAGSQKRTIHKPEGRNESRFTSISKK